MSHHRCLEALIAAMALPKVVAVPDQALPGDKSVGAGNFAAQGPPRRPACQVHRYRRAG